MKEAKVTPKFRVGDVLERKDGANIDRVSAVMAIVEWDKKGNPTIGIQYMFPSQGRWHYEHDLVLLKSGL